MEYICKYNDTHIYIVIYREPILKISKVVNPSAPQPPVAPWVVILTTQGATNGNQANRRSTVFIDYGRIGSHRSPKLRVILSGILWKHMQCILRRQFRHWKTKSRHDATLPPPAASEAVILTTCDATSEDKVGTTTTLGPQRTYFVWRYLLRQICR